MNEENEMKEETSRDKRCCFCFPLQYGLIAWGYFKMIVSTVFITIMSYALLHTCMMLMHGEVIVSNRIYADIAVTVIALTLFVTDLLMTIMFIVGGNQINMKISRIFYFFSVIMWAVTILLTAMALSLSMESWLSHAPHVSTRSSVIHLLNFSAYFAIIIVQTYFLLLLKSTIIKLRNNGEFRFVNNATAAECTMKCKENVAGDETDTDSDDG